MKKFFIGGLGVVVSLMMGGLMLQPVQALESEEFGTITGRVRTDPNAVVLSHIAVCAIDMNRGRMVKCTLAQPDASYTLKLPVGSYIVQQRALRGEGLTGGYTEFITCGLNIYTCTSHRQIIISVTKDSVFTNINPVDWILSRG